jgi:hypothetical protein
MKEFFVNTIIEQDGSKHGITTDYNLVLKNLDTAFGNQFSLKLLKHLGDEERVSGHFIERMGNYVGYLQYYKETGFTLKLSDFEGDIDKSLDLYLDLESKGWKKEDRIKYIEVAHKIIGENGESKMTQFGFDLGRLL